MSALKILHLATHDHGGAGAESVYINEFLNTVGFYSRMLVCEKKGDSKLVIPYKLYAHNPISAKLYRRWNRLENRKWQQIQSNYGFTNKTIFDTQRAYVSAKSILSQAGFTPDLILLHWVSSFITPRIINDLKRLTGARIAWLMLDNAPITGGCHYPFSCKGYESDCQNCPLFSVQNEVSKINLSAKLNYLPEDLEFWGTSADVERAKQSAIGKDRIIRPLLFPIDESLISLSSKEELRSELGLPANKQLILIGSTDLTDIRKGGEYMLAGLVLLKERYPDRYANISLVLVGNNNPELFRNLGYDVCSLGRLPLSTLMKVYRAVNLFLSCSVEDSGPLMVNYSIASGTPVVCFDLGVAKDLVISNVTGYKAPLNQVEKLLQGLIEILDKLKTDEEAFSHPCEEIYKRKRGDLSLLSCINSIITK